MNVLAPTDMPPGILAAYNKLVEAAGGQVRADELIENQAAPETAVERRALHAYRDVAGLL